MMEKVVRLVSSILLVVGLAMAGVACGSASPTPTAVAPKAAPSPAAAAPTAAQPAPTTKAEAAPTTAKPAIQWVGDKLQPMADGFPTRTISLYSGFQAGHVSDIYLRLVAEVAKRYSPVPVIVENRVTGPRLYWDLVDFWGTQPGGTEGYALGEVSFKASVLRSLTVDIGAYTHKDINPVIMTEFGGFGYGVRGDDDRFKTIQDVVQWAKANPKKLKLGSSSVGSAVHLAAMALGKQAGFDFTYVPHSGATESLKTLMGGGVDVAVAGVADWVSRTDLRVLLLTGEKKASQYANVPLAGELKYDVPFFAERGMFTHPKVSPERTTWLYELFKKVAEGPEYEKRTKDQGSILAVIPPDQVRKGMDALVPVAEPMVKELGLHKSQVQKK